MSCYNLMKKADREQYRADHQAELDAVNDGTWPRNINDQMRWIQGSGPEYAARCCKSAIEGINDTERRLAAGDPDLKCWEGWVAPVETA